MPVSYTHLDVYKRQLISLCRGVMGLWGVGDFQAASFADLWRNGFGMPYACLLYTSRCV